MTETGTQTWHELAERVSDMENRIDEALSAYYRGATMPAVIERIREAQESKVTEQAGEKYWTDWLENPGTGHVPVPEWAESVILAWNDSSVSHPCRYSMVAAFSAWDNDYLTHITHYRYAVPADLAWLAENVSEWPTKTKVGLCLHWDGGNFDNRPPDSIYHWSPGLDMGPQRTKDQWLRARRDLGYDRNEAFGPDWEHLKAPFGASYRDDDGTLYFKDQFGNWNAGCTRPNLAPDDPAAHYQNHYKGVKLDPYRIADIYQIPAGPRWQILKKTLRGTTKGQSEQEVINEIRSALDRWQEMVEEDYER